VVLEKRQVPADNTKRQYPDMQDKLSARVRMKELRPGVNIVQHLYKHIQAQEH
jgi:hypothetical protein